MLTECRVYTVVLVLAAISASPSLVQGQVAPLKITVADPISITRLYSDSNGESHFADMELPFELKDYAPPAPPISVTDFIGADGFVVISSPAGWFGDWHPAPRRQYMINLLGILEVEVSDGEVRQFGPGSIVLVEDTTGKGHVSRLVGTERGYMISMPISERQ